jgi:hypothetical protein
LLFPGLPFALFRFAVSNPGGEAMTRQKVRAFSGLVDLRKPAGDLTTLGTGGLLGPDKNPGSYVWQAVADPATRRGVVAGWLTHRRGSGVIFTGVKGDLVGLDGQIDYGRLVVQPGKSEELETFAVGYFDDARLGLEAWADAVAKVNAIKLPAQPAGYCTWYSDPHGLASDETHLAELARFAAKELAPFGFSVAQIDDHWQAGVSTNGPKRNFTTNDPNGPYPGGMKAAADNINRLGLRPGLWFMPFAGTYYDPFFKDHQDWFVQRQDGLPYETDWGGTCLDMTQPEARDYLRANIRRIGREWGYRYFKMDGLWTGTATKQIYVNSGYRDDGIGDSVFHDPTKTGIEAYRSGLKLVREEAGRGVFLLGCCSPQNMRSYGAAMGLVDAMRIGPDNGADWEGLLRGPTFGSRQYFLSGRVWYNDPDPVYVRSSIPLNQAQLIGSWVALSGQLNLSSEWLPGLPPERLNILKRTMPSHGLRPRPADLFNEAIPGVWLLTDDRKSPRRDVVGLFNWTDQEKAVEHPLGWIGLDPAAEYWAFDYWGNRVLGPVKDRLRVTVPARSCLILAMRRSSKHPVLVSTSRHVTQGIVDVTEESWDATPHVLSGKSRVVGGDAYELRIMAGADDGRWLARSIELSGKDRRAGVTASYSQENGLLRAKIASPTGREVSWKVRFARVR